MGGEAEPKKGEALPPAVAAKTETPPAEAPALAQTTAPAEFDPDIVVSAEEMSRRAEQMQKVMWVCPQPGGSATTIIQSADKPMDECVAMEKNDQKKLADYKGKPMRKALVEEQLKSSVLQLAARKSARTTDELKADAQDGPEGRKKV